MKVVSGIILTLGFICFGSNPAFTQNYRFQTYGPEDGLSDNFIYNIIQDQNGYLWLGTGEGIARFDGFTFTNTFPGDTLPKSPVRKSFTDSKNTVWFGFDNGHIAILKGHRFSLLMPEPKYTSAIKGFVEDKEGYILAATQSRGIIRISPDNTLSYITEGLEGMVITSLCMTGAGNILIGTFDGLYLFKYIPGKENLELIENFKDLSYSNIHAIYPAPGNTHYLIGTEDQGLFMVTEETGIQATTACSIKRIGENYKLSNYNIQDIHQDREGNLWIATEGNGIVILKTNGDHTYYDMLIFDESNGLETRYIKDIYEDIEGNYWFASYGGGLIVLRNRSFMFYTFENLNFSNDILSIYTDGDTYWLGGDGRLLKAGLNGTRAEIYDTDRGMPPDKITSLYRDVNGTVWIGTAQSGLFRIKKGENRVQKYYVSSNSLENIINSISSKESKLYVATNGGLLIFDLKTGKFEKMTTSEGLPHNRIRHIFIDSKDQTWIATRSNGIFNVETKNELTIDIRAELEFISIAEDKYGNLWAATSGDGVFMFNSDSLLHYATYNGLRSNYCYSLAIDPNGMVWVGHRLGMSRINPETDNIQIFSVEQGISADCNFNAVTGNLKDNLVFGTTQGLIIYDHTQEKIHNTPPILNITGLKISDHDHDFTQPVYLPYNIYKIRIDFIGINLGNPGEVRYQYKLEGYDDWSEYTDIPFVIYSRLEDGSYTFLLRACNEKGICTETPLSLKINIKIPVWKTLWFMFLVLFTLVASVFIIIKLRERKQKQLQEYLQKALDERTKEVMEQKEEIENKNRDITDSINYAQRIQASILPPIKRLTNYFSGSFVFYQPKDIVSGDFYWYDKVWGNKFLLVCADSTGHGVPGAFMSMIGTTLIKDICSRKEVRSPSQLLQTLDNEIRDALNQNKETEKSNDGMDIIVAEIDLDTKILRLASAMRPVILYLNKEQIYVKGSRNSVGGRFEDEDEEKEFTDEVFELSKGDIVYMFSDGYPDQFGGPLGKKFKMVRLKNLLRDIHEKPMDEQYNYVKNNFMLWKEELEQVDDVLFMGIKI